MRAITPTERQLLEILSDGSFHSVSSLKGYLYRSYYGTRTTLFKHISNLRKKLPPGQIIITQSRDEEIYYRLARLVPEID